MIKYNPNIHHRRSIRLKGYDYSQSGLYFITICCQNRVCRFGKIENGEMNLNEYGQIAHNEWLNTPNIRKNVSLGEFIIMPNHIHGIIRILRRGESHSPHSTESHSPHSTESHSPHSTESHSPHSTESHSPHSTESHSPHSTESHSPNNMRSPSQSIGAIVRGYKSSVTKQLGILGFNDKLWQRNYHENIIRNEKSHQNISKYIINNPAKWTNDKFHSL